MVSGRVAVVTRESVLQSNGVRTAMLLRHFCALVLSARELCDRPKRAFTLLMARSFLCYSFCTPNLRIGV
jgi:hypothetical protein